MQQPSPALSSPSTGFFGPRASPLFTQTVDQPDPPPPPSSSHQADASRGSHLPISSSSADSNGGQQAPPKQLAQAMEALSHALRVIAEIRVGGDMLIQSLVQSSASNSPQISLPSNSIQHSDFVSRASDAMTALFEELRATGRRLEALGVMNGAQQHFEEKHPWGLQLPLICPDGAIVAYSWKRQIAGQAAASAVERTRLALKAFTEQKRRFFRRMGDPNEESEDALWLDNKRLKSVGAETMVPGQVKVDNHGSTLLEVLKSWQSETPVMTITSYTRLEWAKHKSTLAAEPRNGDGGLSDKLSAHGKPGLDTSSVERVCALEVVVPSVFKAIISLFPSGSTTPDAVSVFSADEISSNAHLGGTSAHAVFRRVSECATSALHSVHELARPCGATPLALLLCWLSSYRSLFSKPCSQCKRHLALDGPSDSLLPPVVRPVHQVAFSSCWKAEDINDEKLLAYHLACLPKEESAQ